MDDQYKTSSTTEANKAEDLAKNIDPNTNESKEAQIIAQINVIFNNFSNDLERNLEFIYNICRVNNKAIKDSLKTYNFADLIFNSIPEINDNNLLIHALYTLAIFVEVFPEHINSDFLLFSTNSILQIQEISPETVPLLSAYIVLTNSLLSEHGSIFFINQDFLSFLSSRFLVPGAEEISIPILDITQKIIFYVATMNVEENQEKAQILDRIHSDIVSLALSLIMHDNSTDFIPERTNILYNLLKYPNFISEIDAQAALEAILDYEQPAIKEIFNIFAIWKDFENLIDVIVISAHDCLETAMLDESADLKIAAMKMMLEFIKKDKNGFRDQFLSYMPEIFIKNLINIIFNGSVTELSVAGTVLASVIKTFPDLFENPIYWLLNENRDNECYNILLAIDKVSGGVEKLTLDFFLGLEFIGSHLRQVSQHSELFIQALTDMGIKEMIIDKIDDEELDPELVECIAEDLFGPNESE